MMSNLTQLSQVTTSDGDVVTLWQTDDAPGPQYAPGTPAPFDGHRRRYVFSVDGKGATGWGAVGAGIDWKSEPHNGRNVDPWESGAVPCLDLWADADAFGDAETFPPVTVRGVTYRFGLYWAPAHPASGQKWRIASGSLDRADGARMTDAGRRRMGAILTAARDLFLALPDMERETIRRSLTGRRDRVKAEAIQLLKQAQELDTKLTFL